jgi:hypothetical protein
VAEALVTSARVAAGHEGVAELVVIITHEGGGVSQIALDHLAASTLLESCGAETPDGIIGAPWQKVRDALGVSWNRFNAAGTKF